MSLQLVGLLVVQGFSGLCASAAEKPDAPEIYRLQPGDLIAITVRPQDAYDDSGVILRDGMISLKRIGLVKAAGSTPAELGERLRKDLSDRLVSPRVTVSIVRLHTTAAPTLGQITVIGAVTSPGGRKLDPGLRLFSAVEAAGLDLKRADLKRLEIVRKDLTRIEVDLSTPQRVSDPAQNILLQDGDSVEVPELPFRGINVRGAVVRPGALELVEGLRLHKALELSGGSLAGADLSRITVRRQDLSRLEVDLSAPDRIGDPDLNLMLEDGDTIDVPLRAAPDARVRIRGEVANPGRYEYRPSMTLEDLILVAGKFNGMADLEHIQLQRSGEPIQTVNLIAQKKLGLAGDVRLQPDDEVFVLEQKDTILLLGAVPRPGRMAVKPGQTLVDFFTKGNTDAPSLLDPARADLGAVQVIRRGQEPRKVNLSEALLKPARRKDATVLQSGDIVFFPLRQTRTKRGPLEYLGSLGSLALLFGF